jgi:hypothetical protein
MTTLYKIKEKLQGLDMMKHPKRDGEARQSKQSTCNWKKKKKKKEKCKNIHVKCIQFGE